MSFELKDRKRTKWEIQKTIMGQIFGKKSADILSFRNSFTTIPKGQIIL